MLIIQGCPLEIGHNESLEASANHYEQISNTVTKRVISRLGLSEKPKRMKSSGMVPLTCPSSAHLGLQEARHQLEYHLEVAEKSDL